MVEVRVAPSTTTSCGIETYEHVGVVVDSYIAPGPPEGGPGIDMVANRQAVTIDGVNGFRDVEMRIPVMRNCCPGDAVASIAYSFQVGRRIYLVRYYQFEEDPDLTSEIDTMVTQTWMFLPAD